jgi:uncharacterized alpha-E superfamily protein
MLSRVAETIYWFARYVERAENTARLLRVNAQLVLDTPSGVNPGWEALIGIVGLSDEFSACCKEASERNVVRFLMGGIDHSGSILSSLALARENCRTVREIMPRSLWELINELHLYAKENLSQGISKKGRDDYLNHIIHGSQQVVGLLSSVMYRDEAFHFMRIGRNLERADMTTRIIDVRSTDLFDEDQNELLSLDALQWISVLKSLSGFQSYRRTHEVRVSRARVLDFLFNDANFPRSVAHSLNTIEESVGLLGDNTTVLRRLRAVARVLRQIDMDQLSQAALHQGIDEIQLGIMDVHDALGRTYFLRQYDTSQTQAQSQSA